MTIDVSTAGPAPDDTDEDSDSDPPPGPTIDNETDSDDEEDQVTISVADVPEVAQVPVVGRVIRATSQPEVHDQAEFLPTFFVPNPTYEEVGPRMFSSASLEDSSPSVVSIAESQASSPINTRALKKEDFLFATLDRVSRNIIDDFQTSQFVAGSAMVISSTAIAGYVLWTMRASYAFAWLSGSIPMWASMDPLPVLSEAARQEDGGESLLDVATSKT